MIKWAYRASKGTKLVDRDREKLEIKRNHCIITLDHDVGQGKGQMWNKEIIIKYFATLLEMWDTTDHGLQEYLYMLFFYSSSPCKEYNEL